MWEFGGPDPGTWQRATVPVDGALHDACDSANGPVAVGAGGAVLGRRPGGRGGSGAEDDTTAATGEWGLVVEDGPAARGRTLRAVDATDDGTRVWFAGAGGALGAFDLATGERVDRSGPDGSENTFGALCVAGERGREKLLVADGSGNVHAGDVTGADVEWGRPGTPPGGSALAGLAAAGPVGYGVDGDGDVWRTTAEGWDRVGIDDADATLTSVAAVGERLLVGGSGGRVYAVEDGGDWVPFDVGGGTVRSVDLRVGEGVDGELLAGGDGALLAVGRDGDWATVDVDGDAPIRGVALATPAVAVGAGGLLLERTATGDDG
jgi:hypothetical protein